MIHIDMKKKENDFLFSRGQAVVLTCPPLPERHLPRPLPIVCRLPVDDSAPPAEVKLVPWGMCRWQPPFLPAWLCILAARPNGCLTCPVLEPIWVDGQPAGHVEPGAAATG